MFRWGEWLVFISHALPKTSVQAFSDYKWVGWEGTKYWKGRTALRQQQKHMYQTAWYSYTEQNYKCNTFVFVSIFHELNSKT